MGACEFPTMWSDLFTAKEIAKNFIWQKRANKQKRLPLKKSPEKTTALIESNTKLPDKNLIPEENYWQLLATAVNELKSENKNKALKLIQELLDQNDLKAETHFLAGITLELSGDTNAALQAYGQALFLDKSFTQAHWRRAMLLGAAGKTEQAILAAKQALEFIEDEDEERIKILGNISKTDFEKIIRQTIQWLQI